jgi:glycosyltransferase involved in cell wall biosynthesis
MSSLSVVIATRNEEANLGDCLASVRNLAREIVVVDEGSEDKTVEIAREYGAKVKVVEHEPIFHKTKQKAMDLATGDWILQLDADERVTPYLAAEIKKIFSMTPQELEQHQKHLAKRKLFLRHQNIVAQRDGPVGTTGGPHVAFFIPRLNFFLGKYLRWGGVYPDGVIRLVRKEKAHFPAESVHEQIEVDGRVGWLGNDLIHMADPTFKRYLERNSRYIDLLARDLRKQKLEKNFIQGINYFLIKPVGWFLLTQIRHKGILDGWQGVVFSFFSALRFPRAYFRYLNKHD